MTRTALARTTKTTLTKYDPQKGLKKIALLEGVEKHFARAKDATKLADRDVTPILGKYGVDRLLLLSVDRFGAFRDYFVFVPTAAPLAMFQVRGELIDLTNNQILWRASTAQKQSLVAIEGNWDQPPDYPNLTQGIRRAEHDAVVYLQNAFFSDAH